MRAGSGGMKADALDLDRHEDVAFRALPECPGRKSCQHRLEAGIENGGMQPIVGQVLAAGSLGTRISAKISRSPRHSRAIPWNVGP